MTTGYSSSSQETTAAERGDRVEQLDRDWRFAKGPRPGAERPDFDDADWQIVRVPHDWAIAGPYEPEGDPHTGKLPWKGEGWYRKTFSLAAADSDKRIYLDFDGVMAMPTVYVNGRRAGGWDYGYMSFRVDATDFVTFGGLNLLAVHVDTRPHHSRWYPGAGIYRKVQLVVEDPVHIAHWGTFVTTPDVGDTEATVRVQTSVENHRADPAAIELETVLVDPGGVELAVLRSSLEIAPNDTAATEHSFRISDPQRWDVDAPRLYTAVSRVTAEGRLTDSVETPFGIRTIAFTADDGFHLNGRRVQLRGVNLHHDLGPLGAAFNTRAFERQIEIMMDMGVNAIRTSHNPPAPEVLDLCDRMGIVVWNEVFDKWDGTATRSDDVSMVDHARKQIGNFARRDRNHPCIVAWSVGNEIFDLEGGKFDDGPGLLEDIAGFMKALDSSRPTVLACCVPESADTDLPRSLDAIGWNYDARYEKSRRNWPDLPIIYSESASAYSTRGFYDFPHPKAKDDYSTSLRISSYDHNAAYYSDIADIEFARMEKDAFIAGEFVWTGFDYIGEPVPFVARGWNSFKKREITKAEESRISSFGIVDLVGIPKDRFYLYRSHWAPEKTTVHILPHWTWPDRIGMNVPVYVYTNGDSAELFINGASQGLRSKDPNAVNAMDRYRLRWEETEYEPGEVKAVAYRDGEPIGEATVHTAGPPRALRLTADRATLTSDGEDLCFVLVEAVDADGRAAPWAMDPVSFAVTGPATIAGVGNGDHHFPAEFDTDGVDLFYGKAMLILRTEQGESGTIRVTASAAGLASAEADVRSGEQR